MEQISPQVRLVAIVGVVLAVLGGGAMLVLNRGASAEAAGAEVVAGPLKVADKAKTTAEAAAKRNAAVAPTPEAPPAATTTPTAKPKPKPTVAANGLPISIATALRRHDVVVVSLFTPGGGVDDLALAEARAGAADADAGFVAVNVLDKRQGEPLTKLLGVQGAPALLVYRSPAELVFRYEGFLDLATVSAAAAGARP